MSSGLQSPSTSLAASIIYSQRRTKGDDHPRHLAHARRPQKTSVLGGNDLAKCVYLGLEKPGGVSAPRGPSQILSSSAMEFLQREQDL